MSEDNNRDYNDAMVEAFVDKPEKTLWYQMSFSKFNVNGVDNMAWNWSWWAFFSGFLFLLYRKAYIPAFVLLLLSMTVGTIPFVGFILMILSGGYSTYFIYKVYKTKLHEIQSTIEDKQLRRETMRKLGGYNQWVVWVYAFIVTIILLSVFSVIFIPFLATL